MTRIPLPGNGGEALQRGVEAGTGMFNQLIGQGVNLGRMHQQGQQFDKKLAQDWQQHLQDLEIKRQYQEHLAQQEQRFRELQPYLIAGHQNKTDAQPLNLELLRAKIEHEKANAEKARREPTSTHKPSELETIAAILSKGDPEKRNALLAEGAATKYGLTLPGAENLPVGSQSFKSLPKNLQAQENADQIKMQNKVNDASKAIHDLNEMQKIINSHPDMARELSYLLGNPEDKSFLANVARRYSDRKKLAAIEKFTKYSNDFVLSAGGSLGNNFTDAKLKALQLSKMHAGNTDEANKAIITNYQNRLQPLLNYGKQLKKARGKYTLPYFEESYTNDALGIRSIEDLSDDELEALTGGY